MASVQPNEQTAEPSLLSSRPTAPILLLTLNRPHVHNALDAALIEALGQALDSAEEDESVRAIVLTGAGRSFCSGDDLKALRNDTPDQFAETIYGLQQLTARLFAASKPIVAALNGPAYGAGLELILACDARLAAENFLAGTPEVRLGLVATNAASLLLPMLMGQSKARLMLFGGGAKSAAWCLESGLVDEVVATGNLLPRAVELASELCGGAPGAVARTRRMLNAPLQEAFELALRVEAQACVEARASAECVEGIEAFFGRRAPIWGG